MTLVGAEWGPNCASASLGRALSVSYLLMSASVSTVLIINLHHWTLQPAKWLQILVLRGLTPGGYVTSLCVGGRVGS